jgi:hypothetical protein
MTISFSRRSLVQSAAAAISVSNPAMAMPVAETMSSVSPDFKLIEALSQIQSLGAERHGLLVKYYRQRDLAQAIYPQMPESLNIRRMDLVWGLPEPMGGCVKGAYTNLNLQDLKRPSNRYYQAWPEAVARRAELISTLEKWDDEIRAIDRAYQIDILGNQIEALGVQQDVFFKELLLTEAVTWEGVVAKARAVRFIYGDDAAVDLGETTDARIAAGMLADILKIAEQKAA